MSGWEVFGRAVVTGLLFALIGAVMDYLFAPKPRDYFDIFWYSAWGAWCCGSMTSSAIRKRQIVASPSN